MSRPVVNNKEIRFVATSGFNTKYGGLETALYIKIALGVLAKHPVDMLVFEMADATHQRVRLAGYDLATDSILDEKTVAWKDKSLPTDTFWLKVDNQGEYYLGTFLFPSEY
jgi:hypothetical protein